MNKYLRYILVFAGGGCVGLLGGILGTVLYYRVTTGIERGLEQAFEKQIVPDIEQGLEQTIGHAVENALGKVFDAEFSPVWEAQVCAIMFTSANNRPPRNIDELAKFATNDSEITFDAANFAKLEFKETPDGRVVMNYTLSPPTNSTGSCSFGNPNRVTQEEK